MCWRSYFRLKKTLGFSLRMQIVLSVCIALPSSLCTSVISCYLFFNKKRMQIKLFLFSETERFSCIDWLSIAYIWCPDGPRAVLYVNHARDRVGCIRDHEYKIWSSAQPNKPIFLQQPRNRVSYGDGAKSQATDFGLNSDCVRPQRTRYCTPVIDLFFQKKPFQRINKERFRNEPFRWCWDNKMMPCIISTEYYHVFFFLFLFRTSRYPLFFPDLQNPFSNWNGRKKVTPSNKGTIPSKFLWIRSLRKNLGRN